MCTRHSRRGFLRTLLGTAAAAASTEAAAASGPTLTAVTLIHGIPGKEKDLETHLLSLTAPTRAEKGCLTYDLYRSPDHPHEFMRFEMWESTSALEAHKQTPHLRASLEKRQREGWTTQILPWHRVPDGPGGRN